MFNTSALLIFFLLSVNIARCRFVMPRYADMDDDDKELYRAAYDSQGYDAPAAAAGGYDHDSYEDSDDLKLGKLDLVKDGLWVIKAKLKELKAFDKALFANLLSTKIKVKELLELKKNKHDKKPNSYGYQGPSYSYSAPEYHAPQPQYTAPEYHAPQPQYLAPEYHAPQHYAAPQQNIAPVYGHDPYYGH